MTIKQKIIGALLALVAILGGGVATFGSITTGDAYTATSTTAVAVANVTLIKNGSGQLGSVVITGTKQGNFQIYNATTSNVSKRTGNVASTTLLLADFPANTATGTYQLDVDFTDGLLFVGVGGVSTGTITFK